MASYQGQYLYLALALVAALMLVAWAGHRYVDHTAGEYIGRIAERAAAQQQIYRLQQLLQNVEQWLGRQFLEPGKAPESELTLMLDELESRFSKLTREIPRPGEDRQNLETDISQWEKHYLALLSGLNSGRWRQNLSLVETSLQPQIANMKARLDHLQQNLSRQASRDISDLSNSASRLSQAILLIAVTGVLLILGAYYFLKIRVIKPMSDTAHALRQEANGDSQAVIPTPKLKETRDLVQAFGEMRHQVIKREQRLDHLAHHDPLTQLPNRLLFKDRLEHALEIAARHNQMISCLFLDLDNFKQINDTMGHLAGDELLVDVAARLKETVRRSDTIARLGGDEFAILLEDIQQKAYARNIARKILHALQKPFVINGQEFHISASIGIAVAPYDDNQSDNLLRDADTAMYEAKRLGKNNYQFFTGELLRKANRQLDMEQRLRKAVRNKELLYHYQPIVSATTGQLICVEALLRWQLPDGKLIYPADFIDLIKKLSLSLRQELNHYLAQSINDLQRSALQDHGIPLRVSINLAPSVLRNSLRHHELVSEILGLEFPSMINLEITEDTLMDDLANARGPLYKLRSQGIPLSLDDFGTGQSSLNHLRSFPFDSIKIDKEFVHNLTEKPEDAILVNAIVQLAHSFNMKVVAEGVETEEQKRHLVDIGCDYLQGYLISKPLPKNQLLEFLQHYCNSA